MCSLLFLWPRKSRAEGTPLCDDILAHSILQALQCLLEHSQVLYGCVSNKGADCWPQGLAGGPCNPLIFLAGQLRQSWERTSSRAINTNTFSQMTSRSTRKSYYKHQLHSRWAGSALRIGKNTQSKPPQANRSWPKSLNYWKAVFVICLSFFFSPSK